MKKLLALLVVGSFLITLTGCPNPPSGTNRPTIPDTSKNSSARTPPGGDTPPVSEAKHEGTVVSVDKEKLVMKDKDGKEMAHKVGADAKITVDGKEGKLEELKKDASITVTTKGDAVTKIEAKASTAPPPPAPVTPDETAEGTLVSADAAKMELTAKVKDKDTMFTADKDTKITVDGKDGKFEDLKKDLKVKVTTTKKGDKTVATKIEASK
jgi:hypothetical protein